MTSLKKTSFGFPLHAVLIVPFVLQVVGTVSLVGYLSLRSDRQAIATLADQLMGEVNERIQQNLAGFIPIPHQINQLNAAALELGEIKLDDVAGMERHFLRQIQIFKRVTFTGLGLENQDNLGAERYDDGTLTLRVSTAASGHIFSTYRTNHQGEKLEELGSIPFDPRVRPWYVAPVAAKGPVWSEIYPNTSGITAYLAASMPFYDQLGELQGVLITNFSLAQINDFLMGLRIGETGQAFIIERSGLMVATSTGETPFLRVKGKDYGVERVSAFASKDVVTKAAVNYLNEYSDLATVQEAQKLRFRVENQPYFLRVKPFTDEYGLDWLIVVAVPESDFIEQIHDHNRVTFLLCAGGLVLAIAVGVWTARWIAIPILQLRDASEAIAAGKLEQEVQVRGINELESLGSSFNRMAKQLKAAFAIQTHLNAELENRVEGRTVELVTAREAADAANQAKSQFLANMSHDLRTPLNGILGYAQILSRDGTLTPKQLTGVETINKCGLHLLALINDILDLSKIEAGKLDLVPAPIHLPSLLQGVIEMCEVKAEEKGLSLVYQASSLLPEVVVVDSKRLRQVLINLVGNGIKFTESGAVVLHVDVLQVSALEARLYFQVRDNGCGIKAADIPLIFTAFEQVGDRQTRTVGTGLGLAISQQIVQLMGGEIQVESKVDLGSNFFFTVTVPLAQGAQRQQVKKDRLVVGYKGEPRTILVVDDRWENRAVLINLLEPLGFALIEAEHGEEALSLLKAIAPDLMIMAWAMPVMDGYTLLSRLRNGDRLQDLPVIVSSASVGLEERRMALDAGGDRFLTKPIDATQLFQAISECLHLEWIFESVAAASPTPPSPAIPTNPILENCLTIVESGNLKKLHQQLTQLATENPQYQPFINGVTPFIQQLNTKKIKKLLRHYIAEQTLNPTDPPAIAQEIKSPRN